MTGSISLTWFTNTSGKFSFFLNITQRLNNNNFFLFAAFKYVFVNKCYFSKMWLTLNGTNAPKVLLGFSNSELIMCLLKCLMCKIVTSHLKVNWLFQWKIQERAKYTLDKPWVFDHSEGVPGTISIIIIKLTEYWTKFVCYCFSSNSTQTFSLVF